MTEEEKRAEEAAKAKRAEFKGLFKEAMRETATEMAEERKKAAGDGKKKKEPPARDEDSKGYLDQLAEFFGIE